MFEPETQAEDKRALEAMEALPKQFQEIWEHLGDYLAAKWALSKGEIKNGILIFALSTLLVFLFSGALLIAVAFVFYGSALLLSEALGGRPWAGYLISGAGLLLMVAIYIRWKLGALRRAAVKKRIQDYEQKLDQQKVRYGVNALERAAASD